MKIGLLSDTHNHSDNLKHALAVLRERGITQVIHAGDITTPEIMLMFMGWQVTFVLGNMDTIMLDDLRRAAGQLGLERPRLYADVTIGDKTIGVTHGDDGGLLLRMQVSGKYDYLVHGHTHRRLDERKSTYKVRVINPGALGGNRPEARSVAVLDVATDALEFITFPAMI